MEITPKIRKLICGMFDTMIEGADKYVTDSSMWLIFTEEKRWVIEFTNKKTLWFNYNLFHSELKLLSIDCVESKDIIKEWFESRFLEKDIEHVTDTSNVPYSVVKNVIQNGVKDTQTRMWYPLGAVDETIQNGVKEISAWVFPRSREIKNAIEFGGQQPPNVDKTIKNGVKDIGHFDMDDNIIAEDVIENGVKEVKSVYLRSCLGVGDAIQNGVKETIGTLRRTLLGVDDIIQNGVKDTGARHLRINRKVDDVIQNGVKEVKHKMAESYQQKDHMVTNAIITEDINYAIENGIKE
jgi:hypothetical protein